MGSERGTYPEPTFRGAALIQKTIQTENRDLAVAHVTPTSRGAALIQKTIQTENRDLAAAHVTSTSRGAALIQKTIEVDNRELAVVHVTPTLRGAKSTDPRRSGRSAGPKIATQLVPAAEVADRSILKRRLTEALPRAKSIKSDPDRMG
jgi:hypothetical protein